MARKEDTWWGRLNETMDLIEISLPLETKCEIHVLSGADSGVVRVARSNPLKWNTNTFTILFFKKKDLLNNN